MNDSDAQQFLDLAARLALRAAGNVEPNPLVGAVIVKDNQIIGLGHHQRFGELHAEAQALADCLARGHDPRGSTIYVTLEPCNHYGKQPPCSKALINAGIARVIAARPDPNPISTGGAEALTAAGIQFEFSDASPLAIRISDPFVKRITTGLPWVIAKWAQTPDGRPITRADEPRWISNQYSRRRVHRLRGQVDAVLTGIGTVLADDPLLTVREVRARRIPQRVVIDSELKIPLTSALIRSIQDGPVTILTSPGAMVHRASHAADLKSMGVKVVALEQPAQARHRLIALLAHLHKSGVSSVLVEAGPGLLKPFLDEQLADELMVYIGCAPPSHSAATIPGFTLWRTKRLANDLERRYRRGLDSTH